MNLVQILDDGQITIDSSLWLYNEFSALQKKEFLVEKGNLDGRKTNKRSAKSPKHIRVIKYLYLRYHPKLLFETEHLSEEDRIADALDQAQLEQNILKDKTFLAAEVKFQELCNTLEITTLMSMMNNLHNVIKANDRISKEITDLLDNKELAVEQIEKVLSLMEKSLDLGTKVDKVLKLYTTAKEKVKQGFMSEAGNRGDLDDGWEGTMNN